MSAETLRAASRRIRHDVEFGQAHGDDGFLLAVADWLDATGDRLESYLDTFAPGSRAGATTAAENTQGLAEALTVARAYLGSAS